MKIWIISLSVFLCASFTHIDSHSDHQHMMSADKADSPRTFSSSEALYVDPATVSVGYLSVKPMDVKGFQGSSEEKINKAFEVLEKVVNSEEFKSRIINFKNRKGERAFASNQNLSNEEIFGKFMSGQETLQPETEGEMNFYVSLYNNSWSKVIGWTNPKINTININWKYFKNFKPNEVAGNLTHEWIHKIGFGHKSASEHDSAPYAIGYIVREMGERYLKGEELH